MFLDRMIHYHVSCISSSPLLGPLLLLSKTLSPVGSASLFHLPTSFPTLTNSNLFQVLLILSPELLKQPHKLPLLSNPSFYNCS